MNIKELSQDYFLRDGTPVHIRAIRPDDKQRLLDGFHQLTRESIYYRFFTHKHELTEKELQFFTEVDFNYHVAIVADVPNTDGENDIGIGRYVEFKDKGGSKRVAEVAFAVAEEYQHLGVGSLLFKQLVLIAKNQGLSRLVAEVLLDNQGMLKILKRSGFKLEITKKKGVAHIEFDIDSSHEKVP